MYKFHFFLAALVTAPLMQLAAQTGEQQPTGGGWMTFVPLIAIVAIFYFLIIRPQSKKQKETQKMLSALKKGDKVVTIGGLHGTIQTVRENTVILKADENTKLEFSRSAIAGIDVPAKEEKEDKRLEAPEEDDEGNDSEEKK